MWVSQFSPGTTPVAESAEEWHQLRRQLAHWSLAIDRLSNFNEQASAEAWQELEQYLGVILREQLLSSVNRLHQQAVELQSMSCSARTPMQLKHLRSSLIDLRQGYLRVETLLDFYSDAIATRSNPEVSALIRACDVLAMQSMSALLRPLGRDTPPVLTYLDKGLGASILKAGLRLWDGSTKSQVAAIKVVRHNLYRPTSLIHEAGHQIAHVLNWNSELEATLRKGLEDAAPQLGSLWAGWASEVAADAFAFVHTGFASVTSLHDVVDGGGTTVFRYHPGDPHPVSYIRLLLGIEMCQRFYGDGPWRSLAQAWKASYPLKLCSERLRGLMESSIAILPRIVDLTLNAPMRAFGGQSLVTLISPTRVAPAALKDLERRGGKSLYTSPHWALSEPLILLALTGYRAATLPEQAVKIQSQQRSWMLILGNPGNTLSSN